MQSVPQPSESHGVVLQNLAPDMEDEVNAETTAHDDNILMESDDAIGHAEVNADNNVTGANQRQIHETALQNMESGMEADAVWQNLVSIENDTNDEHATVLQNLGTTEDDTKDDESNHNTDAEDIDVEGEDDTKKEERDTLDADLIQMKTLRSTTSTHDDWLHRGPYLNDMPFHTYTEYIDRVRRPREASPSHQHFEFEAHYALSRYPPSLYIGYAL